MFVQKLVAWFMALLSLIGSWIYSSERIYTAGPFIPFAHVQFADSAPDVSSLEKGTIVYVIKSKLTTKSTFGLYAKTAEGNEFSIPAFKPQNLKQISVLNSYIDPGYVDSGKLYFTKWDNTMSYSDNLKLYLIRIDIYLTSSTFGWYESLP